MLMSESEYTGKPHPAPQAAHGKSEVKAEALTAAVEAEWERQHAAEASASNEVEAIPASAPDVEHPALGEAEMVVTLANEEAVSGAALGTAVPEVESAKDDVGAREADQAWAGAEREAGAEAAKEAAEGAKEAVEGAKEAAEAAEEAAEAAEEAAEAEKEAAEAAEEAAKAEAMEATEELVAGVMSASISLAEEAAARHAAEAAAAKEKEGAAAVAAAAAKEEENAAAAAETAEEEEAAEALEAAATAAASRKTSIRDRVKGLEASNIELGAGPGQPQRTNRVWRPPGAPPAVEPQRPVGTGRVWRRPGGTAEAEEGAGGPEEEGADAVERKPWGRSSAPSVSKAEAVSGVQAYLTFSDSSHGSLFLHWSATRVEGALASFVPQAAVPQFKLTANGGRSEIMRDVGGPNPKRFYEGWASFVKSCRAFAGRFVFVANHKDVPVAVYMTDEHGNVLRVREGESITLERIVAVGVVPIAAVGISENVKLSLHLFQQQVAKIGAAVTF